MEHFLTILSEIWKANKGKLIKLESMWVLLPLVLMWTGGIKRNSKQQRQF